MRFELTGDVAQQLLQGIKSLDLGLGQVTRRLDALDKESDQAGKGATAAILQWQSLGHALEMVSQKASAAGASMFHAGQRILSGFGRVAGGLVKEFATFDQAITNSVTVTGLMGDAFDQAKVELSDFALSVSRMSAKTPTEIANAFYALGSAGFTVREQLQATTGIIALSEATMSEVPFAAELVTSAMKAYGLQTQDTDRIVNALAKSISSSRLNMERLGYSLPYVAATAKGFNVSLEQTLAMLSLLVDRGLEASMAGTGLRQAFMQLSEGAGPTFDVLKQYGVTLAEIDLGSRSLIDVLGTLKERFAGVPSQERQAAFSQAFGARAVAAISILVDQADQIEGITEKFTGTNAALEMQAKQLDTLKGQWTIFNSTLKETGERLTEDAGKPLKEFVTTLQMALVRLLDAGDITAIGEGLAGGVQTTLAVLRPLVGLLESAVHWFSQLSTGAQGATVWMTALSGPALMVGGALLMITGRLAGLVAVFAMLKASGGMGAMATALTAIRTGAIALLPGIGWVAAALVGLHLAVKANVLWLGDLWDTIKKTASVAATLSQGQEALEEKLVETGMGAKEAERKSKELSAAYVQLKLRAGDVAYELGEIWAGLTDWMTDAPGGVAATDLLRGAMNLLARSLEGIAELLKDIHDVARDAWEALRSLGKWRPTQVGPGGYAGYGIESMKTYAEGVKIGDVTFVQPAMDEMAGHAAAYVKPGGSPPRIGPLSTIDKDGMELMRTLAGGIERGIPLIAAAGEKAAEALKKALEGIDAYLTRRGAEVDILKIKQGMGWGGVTQADVDAAQMGLAGDIGRALGRVSKLPAEARLPYWQQFESVFQERVRAEEEAARAANERRLQEEEWLNEDRAFNERLAEDMRQLEERHWRELQEADERLRVQQEWRAMWEGWAQDIFRYRLAVREATEKMHAEVLRMGTMVGRQPSGIDIGHAVADAVRQARAEYQRTAIAGDLEALMPGVLARYEAEMEADWQKYQDILDKREEAEKSLQERAQQLGNAMWEAALHADSLGGAFRTAIESIGRQFTAAFAQKLMEPVFVPLQKWLDSLMADLFRQQVGKPGEPGYKAPGTLAKMPILAPLATIAGGLVGGGSEAAFGGAGLGLAIGAKFGGPWGAVGGALVGGLVGGATGGKKGRNPQHDETNRLLTEINSSLRPQADWFRTISTEALFGPAEMYYGGRGPGSDFSQEYVVTAARGSYMR